MKLNSIRNLFVAFIAMLFLSSFAKAVDLCYYKVGDIYIPSHSVLYVKFVPEGTHDIYLNTPPSSQADKVIKFKTIGPTYQEHKAQFAKIMSQCQSYNHLARNPSAFNN